MYYVTLNYDKMDFQFTIKDLHGDIATLYYYLVNTEINTDSIPRRNFQLLYSFNFKSLKIF